MQVGHYLKKKERIYIYLFGHVLEQLKVFADTVSVPFACSMYKYSFISSWYTWLLVLFCTHAEFCCICYVVVLCVCVCDHKIMKGNVPSRLSHVVLW